MSVLIYFKDREKVSIRNKDSSILLYILKIVRRQLYKYWLRPEVCNQQVAAAVEPFNGHFGSHEKVILIILQLFLLLGNYSQWPSHDLIR